MYDVSSLSEQKGYDELQNIVPTCQQAETLGSQKMSKATVLQRCKFMCTYSTSSTTRVTRLYEPMGTRPYFF